MSALAWSVRWVLMVVVLFAGIAALQAGLETLGLTLFAAGTFASGFLTARVTS